MSTQPETSHGSDIEWQSAHLLKTLLYSRLASPLNNALGRLAIARHIVPDLDAGAVDQLNGAEHSLEQVLNLLKAWAMLVHVATGGPERADLYSALAPDALPGWLTAQLQGRVTLSVSADRDLRVHRESFYEGMLLAVTVAEAVGKPKQIALTADPKDRGVWLRVIFDAPASGPYTSLGGLHRSLVAHGAAAVETVFALRALKRMLAISGAKLRLQNNTQTGEQALAALVPVMVGTARPKKDSAAEADAAPELTPHLSGPILAHASGDQRVTGSVAPEAHTTPGHTLARPVLAPTPRQGEPDAAPPDRGPGEAVSDSSSRPTPDVSTGSQPPGVPQRAEQDVDDSGDSSVNNAVETLIVPPPDFRQRLIKAMAASAPETASEDSGGKPEAPPDADPRADENTRPDHAADDSAAPNAS